MRRIAVDLTPILPGGLNGGAKIMSLQLVKELAQQAPDIEFIILASKTNTNELSSELKADNIKVMTASGVTLSSLFLLSLCGAIYCLLSFLKLFKLSKALALKSRLRYWLTQLRYRIAAKKLKKTLNADLLFCPFTAPFYHHLNIPIVSVIYDLQSHYYPDFFTAEEYYERKKHFEAACQKSNKLVCISDFVKQTILENSNVKSEKVKTIHIRLAHRLPEINQDIKETVLHRYQLTENNYLLFPANFWAHKNHKMLFTAFNMYCHKYPASTLKLVCTGADNHYKTVLQNSINNMGLEDRILMPGFLSDAEFASIASACCAVIFPSLYEGFGMPVLEAMAMNKPVLCSNSTSLPEVAGTAALLFDPRKPQEMAEAIHRIEHNAVFAHDLIKLGNERIAQFSNEADMAKEYLHVFNETLQTKQS